MILHTHISSNNTKNNVSNTYLYNGTYNIKDMCMTNRGYDFVSEIVLNVMGFNDWLQDKEIVEPMKGNIKELVLPCLG